MNSAAMTPPWPRGFPDYTSVPRTRNGIAMSYPANPLRALLRFCALVLLTPLALAQSPGAGATAAADPAVWGVYAQLVGHRYQPPTSGFPGFEIAWTKPGEEMRESVIWLEKNKISASTLIKRGARTGQLIATNTHGEWIGTIEADGSVLFLRDAYFKKPYRTSMAADGTLEVQSVRLKDDQVAAITISTPYTREGGPQTVAAATTVAASAPVPGQPAGTTSNATAVATSASTAATDSAAALPAGSWGVLEKIAGKTWQQNSDGWMAHRALLTYAWSADRHTIELTHGDGYSSQRVGDYQTDPATPGRLITNTIDEYGKSIRAPVTIDANGALTEQLSEKRRTITALDANGTLIKSQQKLTWGGDWKTIETHQFVDAAPGPAWGLFAQLAGYNWSRRQYEDLYFVWLPAQRVIRMRYGHPLDPGAFIDFSLRAGHHNQIVGRGEANRFFDSPLMLMVTEGDSKATRLSGDTSFHYELATSPDRLIVRWEKMVDGDLKAYEGVFVRESRTEKNQRIANATKAYEQRAASARTSQSIRNQEALHGILSSANEVAAAQVAQSQAELDATLEQAAMQVEMQRLEEAARQQAQRRGRDAPLGEAQEPVRGAGDEAGLNRTIAAAKQAGGNSASVGGTSAAVQPPPAKPQPATRPLRFYITGITDALTRKCVSSIVSIPGPAGWPTGPNADQARALIEPYKQAFATACGSGADGQGTQSISYQWNRESDGELNSARTRDLNPQQKAELVEIQL